MLTAEEGRARLDALADPDWWSAAEGRVRKLPRRLRPVGEALLAPRPSGWDPEAMQAWTDALRTAAQAVDELDVGPRTALMRALHPGLSDALSRWWVDARAQPYGWGWHRRAFRAPNAPHLTREPRALQLVALVAGAGPFDQPPEWFAAWAPYLSVADPAAPRPLDLGPVLAAAIDGGGPSGDATFGVLVDSGNGDHPIGGMGRHVIAGLLRSGRPDGWAFVESLLLAAQRQEGLRQSILEAADEAHPDAFTRIIDLVVREDLLRFAATVRAVGVWFGFPESAEHLDVAARHLELLATFRADRDLAGRRTLEGDAWETYAGLCAIAQFDVEPALALAHDALELPDPHNRAAALRFLTVTGLPASTLVPHLTWLLSDPDLRVASLAHRAIVWRENTGTDELYRAFDDLARRLPATATTGEAVGIDPDPVPLDRGPVVASLVQLVGARPLEPLLDHLAAMDPPTRANFARAAGRRGRLDGDVRRAVVAMVGDRSPLVRQTAVEAMASLEPEAAEALALEALLTRKAGDLRRGVISLLGRQPGDRALASAERLWSGTAAQRDAACELLGVVDHTDAVVALAKAFVDQDPSPAQREALEAVARASEEESLDATLGLYHPADLTPPTPPRPAPPGRRFADDAAFRIADALDDLAEAHRNTPFTLVGWQGSTEVLLADARWLPSPFHPNPPAAETDGWGMVLAEVFNGWWTERPAACRGASEALDALRALAVVHLCADHDESPYLREIHAEVRTLLRPLLGEGRLQLRHPRVVRHVLEWLLADTADATVVDECVEATEAALATVPQPRVDELATLGTDWRRYERDWRSSFAETCPWMGITGRLLVHDPFLWTAGHIERWYGLMRWFDRPVPGAPRLPVDAALLHAAHAVGVASDADVYEDLVAGNAPGTWGTRQLLRFTKRRRDQVIARHPTVVPLADRVRERTLEIERARGELSTPASHLAFQLASIEGADVVFELLARLGRSTLVRGYVWNNAGREAVYSRLLQVSYPAPEDSAETVAALVERHRITDRRLVDLAMFAPQWAPLVEQVLGWDGLEDAVWWFHAHTKDDRWSVEAEVRESWAAQTAERTPLAALDLTEGAVDVAWFGRAHRRLGAERWGVLHKAAKLASGGSGHRRAQIFAEAMLGELDEDRLVERITTKRHQDSVRALGLLPLPDGPERDPVALRRYQVLREFERGAKAFGQQRQRSETLAVRIAVENLARTTGAPDPQRFVWAMEAAEAGDLADGPVHVRVDDVTVTLAVDRDGVAEISVRRGDKTLKAVPAPLRKHPDVKALTDRRTALRRQAGRVRSSLEDAMVRQDRFVDADLSALGGHPVVAPMLQMVVWVDDAGITVRRREHGWVDAHGQVAAPAGAVRLVHPVDLVGSGDWIDWQRQFFDDAERQPFKQVFRELYVLTAAEEADSPVSRRWSGHQLQPRQAHGLFTARGWISDRDGGEVARVHHHAGIVARVSFVDGWGTPAEVELPTIEGVRFTERNDYVPLPLASVPPVVFSETMRDLDLVVSVAHAGGVDPEATASTVEMRAALVRETARVLQLDNVELQGSHVLIEGKLGEYSVHLGSGTVHRRPGGALCIIPVDAQRRGRLFLPFADDDPRSAEIVSKVLLLARDHTIKDPTILEQLRS